MIGARDTTPSIHEPSGVTRETRRSGFRSRAGLFESHLATDQEQPFDPDRLARASVCAHQALQLVEPVLDDVDLRRFRLTYRFDHQETLTVEGNVVSRSADSR